MQSPPFPRYLVPPRSKYSPQHHILKHHQLPFLPQCQRPGFTPIQHNRRNYSSIYFLKQRCWIKKKWLYYLSKLLQGRISHYIWPEFIIFFKSSRHSKQMSYAAALCSFARYEPWTKKDIIPTGRGRERICQIVRGQLLERGQDVC